MGWVGVGWSRRSSARRSLRRLATARAAPNAASAYLGSSPAPAPRFTAQLEQQREREDGPPAHLGGCRAAYRTAGNRAR